jgi:acid phosphatase
MSQRLNLAGNCGVPRWFSGRLRNALAGAFVITILAGSGPVAIQAAECPAELVPNIPASEEPAVNIDKHKKRLLAYQSGDYNNDIVTVMGGARKYVGERVAENRKLPADQMKRLAIVLDIDETSLSNWDNIKANNFGFIPGGTCFLEPGLACGFNEWIAMGAAPAIKPTLDFFNFVKSRNIAVFFITGRRNSQRLATIGNLDREGFQGWAGLRTRPDDQHGSIVPFKSSERAKLVNEEKYAIIANVGDQDTDLVDASGKKDKLVECVFKLPNPFYFID